ncbi:hypothetical protein DY000_02062162 [Brassica cretica]|uniref:START domain-containing protein n=1 Tax=Brassica cretica TaxID=69181 RepID=A0ABQ7B496_BRACR|nr:hypothetical protein DY000_02062162 [Brassica cretica]
MSEAFASADDIKSSFFQVSYDQIYDEWIAMRLIDPAGFVLRKVLRSSDNHVDSATIVVVSFVVRPSSAFIPGLVSLRGLLRRRISFCSQPRSQDFAVSRGVSPELVELAEGVFVISLIANPRITHGSGLIRTDHVSELVGVCCEWSRFAFRPALPVRSNRGFPPLPSLAYRTESFLERIGFWPFSDVCQRPPRYRWRHRWDPS